MGSEEMQADVKAVVKEAFLKHTVYKDVATCIKQEFDKKYPAPDNKVTNGVYHCVVGTNFAVSVTYETHFSATCSATTSKCCCTSPRTHPSTEATHCHGCRLQRVHVCLCSGSGPASPQAQHLAAVNVSGGGSRWVSKLIVRSMQYQQ